MSNETNVPSGTHEPKQLWFKEDVTYKPIGEEYDEFDEKGGYLRCFVRYLEEGETIDTIDQEQEHMELMDGSTGKEYTNDFYDLMEDDFEDENEVEHLGTWEFYIGDDEGYPEE